MKNSLTKPASAATPWPAWLQQPLSAMAALLLVAGLFVLGGQPVAVGLFKAPCDKLAHAGVFGLIGVRFLLALKVALGVIPRTHDLAGGQRLAV
jgi:hypothetical protein